MDEIDTLLEDLKRTHIIVNAEAGHGKSSSVQTIVKRLREREPKTIIKVFDLSMMWYNRAPIPHRQKITPEMIYRLVKGNGFQFGNINNCVYELGELSDEMRQFFIAVIIEQDYLSRYHTAEHYGLDTVKNLPRIVYVFEESDIYFQSRFLNSKQDSARVLSQFVKVGRNFGLRGICIVTAAVGELGTKLRRRSKHLIGKIISDSDLRAYNRLKKGLGNRVTELPRFKWIYYNGAVSKVFNIPDVVESMPKNYVWRTPTLQVEKSETGISKWVWFILIVLGVFLLGYYLG